LVNQNNSYCLQIQEPRLADTADNTLLLLQMLISYTLNIFTQTCTLWKRSFAVSRPASYNCTILTHWQDLTVLSFRFYAVKM